jgi:hypothetical protein
MATSIKIKNNTILYSPVKDLSSRRMIQFENKIIAELKRLGVHPDFVSDFNSPKLAMAPKRAHIEWGLGNSSCCLTVNREKKYVDNLQLAYLCIKADVDNVLSDNMTITEFESKYAEHGDVHENRKWAREHLGVHHECSDMEEINKAYKELAKLHHPDMEGGSVEKFKTVNEAHKILKRELE